MITVARRGDRIVVLVDGVERITYVGEPGDEALREMVRELLGDDALSAIESALNSDLA